MSAITAGLSLLWTSIAFYVFISFISFTLAVVDAVSAMDLGRMSEDLDGVTETLEGMLERLQAPRQPEPGVIFDEADFFQLPPLERGSYYAEMERRLSVMEGIVAAEHGVPCADYVARARVAFDEKRLNDLQSLFAEALNCTAPYSN